MTIHNVMRPCSKCLRMRQTFKDGMGRVFQKPRTHTAYTVGLSKPVIVDNATHKIVDAPYVIANMIGLEVYATGGWLYNVETTLKLYPFTRWVKVNLPST